MVLYFPTLYYMFSFNGLDLNYMKVFVFLFLSFPLEHFFNTFTQETSAWVDDSYTFSKCSIIGIPDVDNDSSDVGIKWS